MATVLSAIALVLLYLTFLGRSGLLLPDEPRYAAIGKAMAASGDWITPRLWGHPWFEKPPLIYWLTASFFHLGFGREWAPRLPVALLSVGFLIFFFRYVQRREGERPAWFASIILATSAGWFAYSHIAVMDLPLSVCFSAAMLLALETGRGSRAAAGILLGLAVLAKGLVPLVLFLPALWFLRRRWKDAAVLMGLAAVVALPWFLLCFARNGMPFFDDLIWKQHFARFFTPELQHVQPFWYYLPVLLAGLFPWTPLLALAFDKKIYREPRNAFLLAWFLFGFLFFSMARNKLPGYLLPLLPPLAILAGVRLHQTTRAAWPLGLSALLIGIAPSVSQALPRALAAGATHTNWPLSWIAFLFAAAAACLVLRLTPRSREIAFAIPAVLVFAAYFQFLVVDLPAIDRAASGRRIWIEELSRQPHPSVSHEKRSLRYGICYYADGRIPDCPVK